MGAKQTKEGADVVQKLEHMDVLAVIWIHESVISTGHSCKDQSHLWQQQMLVLSPLTSKAATEGVLQAVDGEKLRG